MTCVSRGNPDPAFKWSWKDSENNTVSISEGEEISGYSVTTIRGNATSKSTLEITKVTQESWTNYTCEVVNALGTDTAFISLSGKSKCHSKFCVLHNESEVSAPLVAVIWIVTQPREALRDGLS